MFEQWLMFLKKERKVRVRTLLIFIPGTCWWLDADNRNGVQLKGAKVCDE